MSYEFKEIKDLRNVEPRAPSDDMKINGDYLSDLVPGYSQISVSGRGIMSESVSTTTVPGRAGAWLNHSQTEMRVLTIRYRLKADASEQLRDRFDLLNNLLRTTVVKQGSPYSSLEITFRDEPNWTYYGLLESAGDFEENTLNLVSEFTLICPDPYKYGPMQTSNTIKANNVIPSRIRLNVTSPTNKLTIKATGTDKTIVLNGSYSNGNTIEIQWLPERLKITKNRTTDITNDLARFSYPEEFVLNNGAVVSANNATVATEWRDKRL